MTTQIQVVQTGSKQWDVHCLVPNEPDERTQQKLGTFYDWTSMTLFLEALRTICIGAELNPPQSS